MNQLQFTDLVIGIWFDKPSKMLTAHQQAQIKELLLPDVDPLISFSLSSDKPTHWIYTVLSLGIMMVILPLYLGCLVCYKDCMSSENVSLVNSRNSYDNCDCDCDCRAANIDCSICIEACCESFDTCCVACCQGLGSCCESCGSSLSVWCESCGTCLGYCCDCVGSCAECCSACGSCGSCDCAC